MLSSSMRAFMAPRRGLSTSTAAVKLVTYSMRSSKTGKQSIGVLLNNDESILPLKNIPSLGRKEIASMQSFIELSGLAGVEKIKRHISTKPELLLPALLVKTKKAIIHAPLPVPLRNVMCVGKNYSDHVAEVKRAESARPGSTTASAIGGDAPAFPVFFTKAPNCVIGYGSPIESHSKITKWLDWEAELAVIIGKCGTNIPKDQAMEYVFGYTIANDVTARELQKKHGQWFKGKTLDGSCPLGPSIVPACSLNPHDLSIRLSVNSVVKQNSRTSKMIHDIPSIISSLSEGFTLRPGDVILTGTPDGVGFARSPPEVLKTGDVVEIEIEGLGRLKNPVV
jgi:2-keto-4-pentenoate hydratase/2-oxohepta-3-ene-1,7-dioic acid hydratase in catechol pathway